jgi:DNA-binding NarL/FixJ family response regulator
VPRGRLRTPSGQWLLIHAAAVHAPGGGVAQVAITLEPAQLSALASLLVKAYEFTDREQQVVLHVLRGLPTDEIARSLCESVHGAGPSEGHLRQRGRAQPPRPRG